MIWYGSEYKIWVGLGVVMTVMGALMTEACQVRSLELMYFWRPCEVQKEMALG